jgi:hypothetical protein
VLRTTIEYGWCHLQPPRPDEDNVGTWPETGADDWCGEHPERRAAAAARFPGEVRMDRPGKVRSEFYSASEARAIGGEIFRAIMKDPTLRKAIADAGGIA